MLHPYYDQQVLLEELYRLFKNNGKSKRQFLSNDIVHEYPLVK